VESVIIDNLRKNEYGSDIPTWLSYSDMANRKAYPSKEAAAHLKVRWNQSGEAAGVSLPLWVTV
jgi:hypothetical protein